LVFTVKYVLSKSVKQRHIALIEKQPQAQGDVGRAPALRDEQPPDIDEPDEIAEDATPDEGALDDRAIENVGRIVGVAEPPPKPVGQPAQAKADHATEQPAAEKSDDEKRASRLELYRTNLKKGVVSTERINAAKAIGAMGPAVAADATRDLCAALVEKNASVRLAAAEALEKVNPTFHKIVFPIAADDSDETRLAGLALLKEMGRKANDAVPIVAFRVDWAATHSNKAQHVRASAVRESLVCLDVLYEIGKDDAETKSLMTAIAATGDHESTRAVALRYLPILDIDDRKRVVAILTTAARADTDANKIVAMQGLAKFGADAGSAVDVLRNAKGSGNSQVREAASKALEVIEKRVAEKKKKGKAAKPASQ
jgi:hypothetical protein